MKLKINNFILIVIILIGILVTNCSKKEENTVPDNGLPPEVNSLVPEKVLTILDSLKMPIFKGDNPPDVTGTFIISPNVLIRTTNEDDEIGEKHTDYFLTFVSPDEGSASFRTITSNSIDQKSGNGPESYIVGDGAAFTVFTKMETSNESSNDSFITIEVYTGGIYDDGISNLYSASVMLDDKGDPNDHYMENGAGRVFMDGDGDSQKVGF